MQKGLLKDSAINSVNSFLPLIISIRIILKFIAIRWDQWKNFVIFSFVSKVIQIRLLYWLNSSRLISMGFYESFTRRINRKTNYLWHNLQVLIISSLELNVPTTQFSFTLISAHSFLFFFMYVKRSYPCGTLILLMITLVIKRNGSSQMDVGLLSRMNSSSVYQILSPIYQLVIISQISKKGQRGQKWRCNLNIKNETEFESFVRLN